VPFIIIILFSDDSLFSAMHPEGAGKNYESYTATSYGEVLGKGTKAARWTSSRTIFSLGGYKRDVWGSKTMRQ